MPPELSRHDQEAVAELLHNPGYRRLLDIMAASEQRILDDVEDEADATKLLRGMRFWQFLHKVNLWLAETPATIAAELDRLRADGQLDDYPVSRDHAWSMRFARMAASEYEEEETSDPASI